MNGPADETLPPEAPPTIPAPPPSDARLCGVCGRIETRDGKLVDLSMPPNFDGFASEDLDDE